ncbi:hypothetical protein JCM19241_435 [Vibrio ishigakensis]|uniref:Uncharacterized protein n=1 Tax=Vibrio ishigakensis TaxID=1481914 RepID=A0A0B8QGC8_9VIBR|nr:hypothetical protein JCM19241_435 [Vibrio ishigakensis]
MIVKISNGVERYFLSIDCYVLLIGKIGKKARYFILSYLFWMF